MFILVLYLFRIFILVMRKNIEDEGMIRDMLNRLIAKYCVLEIEDQDDLEQELWLIYLIAKKEKEEGKHEKYKLSTIFYNRVDHSISEYFSKKLKFTMNYKDYIMFRNIRRLEGKGMWFEDIVEELRDKTKNVRMVKFREKVRQLSSYPDKREDQEYIEEEIWESFCYGDWEKSDIFWQKWREIEKVKNISFDVKQYKELVYDIFKGWTFEDIKEKYWDITMWRVKIILTRMWNLW